MRVISAGSETRGSLWRGNNVVPGLVELWSSCTDARCDHVRLSMPHAAKSLRSLAARHTAHPIGRIRVISGRCVSRTTGNKQNIKMTSPNHGGGHTTSRTTLGCHLLDEPWVLIACIARGVTVDLFEGTRRPQTLDKCISPVDSRAQTVFRNIESLRRVLHCAGFS